MPLDPAPDQGQDWCMVDSDGQRYRLPKTMLFMGSEECDIVVRSQTVDKRHAVITFDHYLNKFKIKDLSTINGTFVNEYRIPDQEYVTLKHMDSVRLGYDSLVYHMEELPDDDTSDVLDSGLVTNGNKMPHWATKELPSMAECEGCIAEQHLAHTCSHGGMTENMNEMDHSHAAYRGSYHEMDDRKMSSNLGSNTWPRKRIRNTQNIATLFATDSGGSFDDGDYCCSRILRGDSSGHPDSLPPELATVKKATPLYGQPDWWGEDDATESKLDSSTCQDSSTLDSSMYRCDNLHKDVTPDKGKSTPPRELRSMSSSISKDSLQSHNTSVLNSPDKDQPHSSKQDSSDMSKGQKSADISMAFTVEFDDESPKMNMVGRLSEFVPSKIRKSFKERKVKTSSSKPGPMKADVDKDQIIQKDVSPERQEKIDDLWKSLNTKPKKVSESISKHVTEGDKDDKVDLAPVKGVKTHKRKLSSGGTVKSKTPKSKDIDSQIKSVELGVSDSANYLIDKMFESGSDKDSKSGRTKRVSDRFTEHALYKEAKQYESGVKKSSSENIHKDSRKNDVTKPSVLKIKDSKSQSVNKSMENSKKSNIDNSNKDKKDKITASKKKSQQVVVEPPPVQKDEDNVSEAGTYTIETEIDSKEEEDARKDIDRVFGLSEVPQDNYSLVQQEQVSRSREGETTLIDLEDEIEDLEHIRSLPAEVDSLEAEVGSEVVLEELKIVEDDETPSELLTDEAPKWVTQWAALTNTKPSKQMNMEGEVSSPSSLHSLSDKEDTRSPSTKKPPSGISRKRPGTGRKLPTLPTDKCSPEGSDRSSRVSESTSDSPRCPSTQHSEKSYSTSDISKQKTVKISSQVLSRYEDTETESVSRTKFESDVDSVSKDDTDSVRTPKSSRSSRSVGSLDTEILLRDTETVMAAMEARMGSKPYYKENGHIELNGDIASELDSESTVGIINGDEEYIKPTQFESPRENLAKMRSKKPVGRVNSASARLQAFRERNYKRHSYGGEKSVVSDVFSETDIADESIQQSDVSSDVTETDASFSRSGSKGKGNMSMTRPNRAFQLRRARADGEVPDTFRTSSSANVSGYSTPKTPGSTTSVSTSSTKPVKTKSRTIIASARTNDSARSEASLGAQIVQKSRDNKHSSQTSAQFERTDGGRHSLRVLRSQSLSTTKDSGDSGSHKTDLKAIKARLKNASNYGLTVTGMNKSSSSSTSQPVSRSNSPKSAEKAAWKRRKEYDPRKAVADAKAKAKTKGSTGKSKMTRSASFTNSLELRNYRDSFKSESLSSADDISSATSDHNGVFDDSVLRRGFLPYSGRSNSSRLYHSSEDEELSHVVKSSQDLSRCLLGSIPYLSAFTPPPPKVTSLMSPSPHDIPPLPLSVFKRSSVDSRVTDNHNSLLKSYDNILVSSIYHLSHKLKNSTDRTLTKLRESHRIDASSPSPIDDIIGETFSANSDIPAWKSANQELANILQNMRKIEHQMRLVNKVLFPEDDSGSETLGLSRQEKQEYLQEIERIRSELAGFQPISQSDESWKHKDEVESVESDCEELGGGDEFF